MPQQKRVYRYNRETDEVEEVFDSRNTRGRAQWPILSDAIAVDPSQVQEANEKMRELHLKPNYHPDGRYEFEDARHRQRHCQHEQIQIHDRNGGYGDPMPPHRRGYGE